jgi:hypothetical protein
MELIDKDWTLVVLTWEAKDLVRIGLVTCELC